MLLRRFEEEFPLWTEQHAINCIHREYREGHPGFDEKLYGVGVANAGGGLWACLMAIGVRGYDVVVPSNTFWATSQSVRLAGGIPIHADCGSDLCMGMVDLERVITPATRVVIVVHIGGHIAKDIVQIARYCQERGIILLEDCAHAHGASLWGRPAGTWGRAGVYSFYATKSMPTGEGGMVVTTDATFADEVRLLRNYGKTVRGGVVEYPRADGFNFRMSEFTAAMGIAQLDQAEAVMEWKRDLARKYDQIFDTRLRLPSGMVSGFYKYIVFGAVSDRRIRDFGHKFGVGKVFSLSDHGAVIEEASFLKGQMDAFGRVLSSIPKEGTVSAALAMDHVCAPIWFGWKHAEKSVDELKSLFFGGSYEG